MFQELIPGGREGKESLRGEILNSLIKEKIALGVEDNGSQNSQLARREDAISKSEYIGARIAELEQGLSESERVKIERKAELELLERTLKAMARSGFSKDEIEETVKKING